MTETEETSTEPEVKDRSLRNIILLSASFMLLFTALVTVGNIEQTVLKSIQQEDPTFTGDGYISLALVYTTFAIANSLSPSLVAFLKPKRTLVFCSFFYVLFIVNLIFTTTWSLYAVSVLLGIAAAGLWTAQGSYLTLNSTKETITRNTGIFWVFLCCSQFVGNGFVFWQFFGKTHIDEETRTTVLSFLTCIGLTAIVCLMFLDKAKPKNRRLDESSSLSHEPLEAFKNLASLMTQRNMQLLIVPFIFLGTNQSFFAGVYPTSLGFTKQLGTISKSLVGLSGIFTGSGGLIGGGLVMIFGSRVIAKFGRTPLLVLGGIFLTTAYVFAYLNIPNAAPLGPTDDLATLDPPSAVIAMMCSFLLGLGDSFLHTQIYGTLSTIWKENCAGAFATLHFFKSCAVSFLFYYSTKMGLFGQFIMLQVLCVLSVIAFAVVDANMKTKAKEEESLPQTKDDSLELSKR